MPTDGDEAFRSVQSLPKIAIGTISPRRVMIEFANDKTDLVVCNVKGINPYVYPV
jgi:hypothetical protein